MVWILPWLALSVVTVLFLGAFIAAGSGRSSEVESNSIDNLEPEWCDQTISG